MRVRSVFALVAFVFALGSASAQNVRGTVTTSVALSSAWILWDMQNGSSDLPDLDYVGSGSLSVGTTAFGADSPLPVDNSAPYLLLATYGQDSGVVVSMNSPAASAAIGSSFATVFPGESESTLEAALTSGTYAPMFDFFSTYASDLSIIGKSSTLIAFSGGTNVGSMVVTPEPAPVFALGLGAIGLIGVGRRHRLRIDCG